MNFTLKEVYCIFIFDWTFIVLKSVSGVCKGKEISETLLDRGLPPSHFPSNIFSQD